MTPCQNPDLFRVNLKMVSERSVVLPDVFAFLPPDRGETPPVCPWSSAEEKSRLRFSLEHFVKMSCILYICLLLSVSALFICLFPSVKETQHSNYSESVFEISAFWSRCSTQDADVNTYTFVPFLPRCRTNTAAGVVTVCCCHHDGVLLS